ncbi:MAG TPA: DUF2277 domain-containing protein [Anaerolineales bacterium]|nr:DUF2277 domain-containing protein [Anaerolineales bacterium]
MCRSIKPLRLPDRPATEQEIQEAALQFVRKVSGYRKPSRANQPAFEAAVQEIAVATQKLLEGLNVPHTTSN